MEPMYQGIPFTPTTTLTQDINEAATRIFVADVSVFPAAPNYASIFIQGTGTGETVKYNSIGTNFIDVERGIENSPQVWTTGSLIGRCFTNKDFLALQNNIKSLPQTVNTIAPTDGNINLTATQIPQTAISGQTNVNGALGALNANKADLSGANFTGLLQHAGKTVWDADNLIVNFTTGTLLNGWTSIGAYAPRITRSGIIVNIVATLLPGTITSGTPIFNLPSWAIPATQYFMSTANTNGSTGRVVVSASGVVSVESGFTVGEYSFFDLTYGIK